MAYDLNSLNQYHFFKKFGTTAIDKHFIEDVILPGLHTQGKYGGPIELPHGINEEAEYLPLDDAAKIAIDWLESHSKIKKEDQDKLEKLLKKSSYENIAILLELIVRNRIQTPEKLLTTRLAANLAAMKEIQEQALINPDNKFNPARDLMAWNKIRTEVERLSRQGVPANLINLLIPEGLSSNTDLTRERFIQLAVNNLPELVSASHLAQSDSNFPSREIAAGEVTRTFEKIIIETAPDFFGYLNLTKNPIIKTGIYNLVTVLEDSYEKEVKPLNNNLSLSDWSNLKISAASALPFLIKPSYELTNLITQKFTFLSTQDQQNLSIAIQKAIVSSASQQLETWQILQVANKSLGFSTEQLNQIHLTLHTEGMDQTIEFYQHELFFDLSDQPLTGSEKRLLSLGINPFEAHFTGDNLLSEARQLLQIPNLSDLSSARTTVEARYQQLLASDNPDTIELHRLRTWLSRQNTVSKINSQAKLRTIADRGRFERKIYNTTSRYRTAQTELWNKWFEFEENLPWNTFARKAFETYERIAEGKAIKLFGKEKRIGILSVPLGKGKKLEIPYLRMGAWIYGGIHSIKRQVTLRTYLALSKEWAFLDPVRRGIRFSLKEYALGGYNINGAIFHFRERAWGSAVRWSINKLGLQSAVKYSAKFGSKTVANAGLRTATRLLIKIGGKSLAKIGAKAVGALIAAATTIGAVISAISIVSMVVDVVRLGFDLVKRFFTDAEFRKAVYKLALIGTTISAVIAGTVTGIPIVVAGILGALAIALGMIVIDILLAGGIALGAFVFVFIFYNMFVQPSIKIDPGLGLFQAIYCNKSDSIGTEVGGTGGQTSRSAVAECATCLVEYLTKCYQNPITGSKMSGQGLGCLLAQAVAPDVAAALQNSAVYFNYLQCVGFARAAAICGGGDLEGRNVASDYIRSPAAGYSLVGAGNCSPGDLGLIDGAIGHIFVVGSNNGATINGIDANFVCTGCVSASTPFPTTSVAGCMKRN